MPVRFALGPRMMSANMSVFDVPSVMSVAALSTRPEQPIGRKADVGAVGFVGVVRGVVGVESGADVDGVVGAGVRRPAGHDRANWILAIGRVEERFDRRNRGRRECGVERAGGRVSRRTVVAYSGRRSSPAVPVRCTAARRREPSNRRR